MKLFNDVSNYVSNKKAAMNYLHNCLILSGPTRA